MNLGQKLTKSQIRMLPAPVTNKVLGLQKYYRTRNCRLYLEDPTWKLHLSEGNTYTCFDGKGKEFTLQMQAGHSLHAGGHRMSYQIGEKYPLPEGSWVVRFVLFLGKPIIDVHHIGVYQLGEG